jgi:hypothetical protein
MNTISYDQEYVAKLITILQTHPWEWTESSLTELAGVSGAHFDRKTVIDVVHTLRFRDECHHRWSTRFLLEVPYECRITLALQQLDFPQGVAIDPQMSFLLTEWEQLIRCIPQHIDPAVPLDEETARRIHPPPRELKRMAWWSCKWGYIGVAIIQPHLNLAVWLDLILLPPAKTITPLGGEKRTGTNGTKLVPNT